MSWEIRDFPTQRICATGFSGGADWYDGRMFWGNELRSASLYSLCASPLKSKTSGLCPEPSHLLKKVDENFRFARYSALLYLVKYS